MANLPSPDRLAAYVRERGEAGVTLEELAREFLRPASAPAALCERILRSVLEKDPRVRQLPDGRWAPAAEKAKPPPGGYTVIEAMAAPVSARRAVDVEAAALRVGPGGEPGERLVTAVRPDPWPPGLVLPPRLREAMRSAPERPEALARAADFAAGTVLVCYRAGPFVREVKQRLIAGGMVTPLLELQRLARSLLGGQAARSREETAWALGCAEREIASAEDAARATAETLAAFAARGGSGAEELLTAQHPARRGPDFEAYAFSREDVASLPAAPGIYIMRDANGQAVYVGKAGNLRRRVSSYFRSRVGRDEKTEMILESVHSLEAKAAGSELEALLMEYRAIRELAPAVNLQFDVHERRAAERAEGRRAIAVLPSVKPLCAELFLARGTEAFRQERFSARWSKRTGEQVRRFFFGERLEAEGDPAEAQIFWSWHTRRRDEARVVDVDAAGAPEEVLRLTQELFRDVLRGDAKAFRV